MKRWRVVRLLLVPALIVLAALAFLGLTERGLRQLARAAVGVSGGALAIEDVQGRLLGTWQLEGIQVQTATADLRCKKIVMQWQPLSLLHGTVRIVKLQGEGVDVRIKEEGMAPGTSPVVLPDILLPLGVALTTFELKDLYIHGISGMDIPPVDWISFDLVARRNHVALKAVEVKLPDTTVHMQGSVGLGGKWPLDLRGQWRMEEMGTAPLTADFVIRGVVTDLVAQMDLLTPVKARLDFTCSDPFGALRWQADTTLSQVRLTDINPEWPDLVLASADLKASGTTAGYQGTAQLKGGLEPSESRSHLAYLPQTQVHAEFSGDFARLELTSLVAQLAEGAIPDKDISSPQEPGTAGAVTDKDVLNPREPGMAGAVTDKDVLNPREPGMAGAVTAQGTIGWQDGLRWQVDLEGKDVDPNPFFPDWKGRINTRINTSGRLQGDDFSSETQLVALDGNLLGYPLAGSGSLTVDGKGVQVKDLLLRSGESELTVKGTVGTGSKDGTGMISAMDLHVQFDSENLGSLLPEAEGTAHLQGSVQGSREAPEFSFELEASRLAYQGNVVQTLTGSGQGTFSPQGELAVKLAGEGVQTGAGFFTSLAVDLGGTVAHNQVQATLTGAAGDVQLALAGGLTAWSWQGEVRDLLLRLDPYGKWQLKSPASLRIDGEGVDLASFCLAQGISSICLQGGWQPSGEWQLNADLDSFATGLLYQWHLVSRPVDGRLTATVRTGGVGARLVKGEARFSIPGLQMSVEDEDGRGQLLRWTDNLLTLELVDSNLVSMAKSRFQDGSAIDATITVGQFSDLSSSWEGLPIQGEIGLDLKNLDSIALLSNYAVKPTGSMKGTFAVQGLLGAPRLIGELRQAQGNIFIPATGITLEKLLLSVMVKGEGEGMRLILDAASGPGTIRIVGDISREEQGE
ncbi:MAG: hypothetical protein PHZ02_17020, partial [Desulfocapsaceae bacterium]|nr:hypothetical protein [Desulfocapsaceae bacterium]